MKTKELGGLMAWKLASFDAGLAEEIAGELDISLAIAGLLANKGMQDAAAAQKFLRPSLANLHDPALLEGMDTAVTRILEEITAGNEIAIYGDYDVDGLCSAAILHASLVQLGARTRTFIPKRLEHGYGLNPQVMKTLADDGVRLVVSVDCGITGNEAIHAASLRGLETIILDHHEPGAEIPLAYAVIDPKMADSKYPFPHLAAAGLAFKLAWALGRESAGHKQVTPEYRAFLMNMLALAALGTICDVVPLVGENRIFAHHGLKALAESTHTGITALMQISGVKAPKVSARDVGFQIGPRLNAAGRMDHAQKGFELLSTTDETTAENLARELDQWNRKRQSETQRVYKAAVARIEEGELAKIIILADASWHVGVVGIVASRLVDRYHRPAAVGGIVDGRARFSARSLEGFHFTHMLARLSGMLTSFGGHALAAGFSIDENKVTAFAEAFCCEAETLEQQLDRPILKIDGILEVGAVNIHVVDEIEHLAPFGAGNPMPVFQVQDVRIAGQPRWMGNKGQHVAMTLHQNGASVRAVAFGKGDLITEEFLSRNTHHVAFTPVINAWKGQRKVEFEIKDMAGLEAAPSSILKGKIT